jgi:predicted kinase
MITIVAGLPGSGKSYFASRLAERLDARYINSDRLRKEMDRMGKYTFHDKLIVYLRMAEMMTSAVMQGRDVVVDATFFRRSFRNLFADIARRYQTPFFFIEVIADDAIVKERLSKPRKESEADYMVYLDLKTKFEPIEEPHLTLYSRNVPADKNLEAAMEYLQGVHEGR